MIVDITAAQDSDTQVGNSASVRAHCQVSTAKSGASQCLGRSCGGLRARIGGVIDAHGLSIRLDLTAGPGPDRSVADRMLNHLGSCTIGLADKTYGVNRIRMLILEGRNVEYST